MQLAAFRRYPGIAGSEEVHNAVAICPAAVSSRLKCSPNVPRKAFLKPHETIISLFRNVKRLGSLNLVPRGCIPFGQHQGCKTSGIINVKMLANRNLIGYYFLPEVYKKEVSKQEIKVLRMLLLDVFDHVREGQWEINLKMGDAN